MILQNRIIASLCRVKMEALAKIPQVDTHAAARMIILGTTAIVSLTCFKYVLIICYGWQELYIWNKLESTQYRIAVYMRTNCIMYILLLNMLWKDEIKY